MAWEWVGPVATAAVGIAGIGATWLTARDQRGQQLDLLQREHAQQRRLRADEDRRRIYAEVLGGLTEALHKAHARGISMALATEVVETVTGETPPVHWVSDAVDENFQANDRQETFADLEQKIAQLGLVGGAEVHDAALAALAAVLKVWGESQTGRTKTHSNARGLLNDLRRKMVKDLETGT
jgi:hypothetical protein